MVRAEHSSAEWFPFWGKAGPPAEGDAAWHPLAYHCLDVAAVGVVLLERNGSWLRRFQDLSGLPATDLVSILTFFLALHDLGKFADGFQALRPDLMETLQGEIRNPGYPHRHDNLGFWYWQKRLAPDLLRRHPGFLPIDDEEERADAVGAWFAAAAGHHGRPPRPADFQTPGDLKRQFQQAADAALKAFVRELETALAPAGVVAEPGDPGTLVRRLRRSSHWFAGWSTIADWIGSNRDYGSALRPEPAPLADYWARCARPFAEAAVRASGLGERRSATPCGFDGLWRRPEWSPSPLQRLAESLPLAGSPQLLIVEDLTGSGKTEAALLLAHRMMAAGSATGIYFALPTMATANAMYQRVRGVHERLFAEGEGASLVLAHSKRDLYLPLEDTHCDAPYQAGRDGEPSASVDCAGWLADSRKKALLAHIGVGTIDQALIAVLPIRHQSLRLVGLAGKVLLVDEVHACDRYVLTLLERLLEFHAASGGSAILLSATLPRRQRANLLAAYSRGRSEPPVPTSEDSYPLLTQLAEGRLREAPTVVRDGGRRSVAIRALRSEGEAERWLEDACSAGGCGCWVRNTVRDAVAAYDRLVARWGEGRVLLFHSRFTVADRRDLEDRVLASFGPDSGPAHRQGKLLIATQVVEQSLDLDFDAMVTDLAPIDLVIQRSGRLRRHARSLEGDRTRLDQRGESVLAVLSPEPVAEPKADWYSRYFPSGSFVYPDHGRLFLTARWLEQNGRIRLPEDVRKAIEQVYGDAAEEAIPVDLRKATTEAEGNSQADKSLATLSALRLDAGYATASAAWLDETWTPTRLGEPTSTLRLVKSSEGLHHPWAGGGRDAWEASEVTVSRRMATAEVDENQVGEGLRRTMRDAGRYSLVVVMRADGDEWCGSVLDARGAKRCVRYSTHRGLELVTERGS